MTNPNTQLLAHWINGREQVRINREAGLPKPWSDDPILRSVRFCNVHREDDKVTRWLDKNWRRPLWGRESPMIVAAVVLARMVNRIETLEEIPLENVMTGDWGTIKEHLRRRINTGQTVWGNAYMISTCGKRMEKEVYVVDHVVRQVANQDEFDFHAYWANSCTLQDAFERLTQNDGLGSFLAGQVIADLKNTPGFVLNTAKDFHTWSTHGPGSLKGLSEYFKGMGKVTPSYYQQAIKECYDEVRPLIHDYVGEIHMQDFQNCMCEFSKYMRVRNGGRAKNSYPG